jgi:hypothetical protein
MYTLLKSNPHIPTNLGEQYVYFFLQNLKKGKASLSSVRKKIIQCSPYYFVSRLKTTRIQMHYGAKDISFVQLQRFNMKMDDLGYKYPNYELFIYPNREHDLVGDKPVEIRVSRFIDKILEYN